MSDLTQPTFTLIPKEPVLVQELLKSSLWSGSKEDALSFVRHLNNTPTCSEDNLSPTASTALLVNMSRPIESTAPIPLYQDKYSLFFTQAAPNFVQRLTNAYQAYLAQNPEFMANAAPPYVSVGTRTAYYDEKVKDAFESGITQFVSLGSGVCTRFLRLLPDDHSDFCFVEVDDANLLRFKIDCLSKNGVLYPDEFHFIGGDYTKGDLCSKLKSVGIDPKKKVVFIWEGNTMYLSPPECERILADILKTFPKASVCFDYFTGPLAMEG